MMKLKAILKKYKLIRILIWYILSKIADSKVLKLNKCLLILVLIQIQQVLKISILGKQTKFILSQETIIKF